MHRRSFLLSSAATLLSAQVPARNFPVQPKDRLAVASYPFRDRIRTLEEFAKLVPAEFKISGIEPWSRHFKSLEPEYIQSLHRSFSAAKVHVVNIAADVDAHPCSTVSTERQDALKKYKQWVDAAVTLQSPGIRVHVPTGADKKADLSCAVTTLTEVARYGQSRNIVISLENDDPRSEDPMLIADVIDRVNSPFLRALPDFCNSMLISNDADYNRRGLEKLFARAYSISHVKDSEEGDGKMYHVDVPQIFGIASKAKYRGYFSMEMDRPGDPIAGTRSLIDQSLAALSKT